MNIIVYVLDALRADHLSCYGYDRETTPNIDDLAADGIIFEQCFAPATWTRPVAASILSGSYPPTHGTESRYDTFAPHVPTLAEELSTEGYDTVGFTSMGNVSSTVNFDRGFDQFYDLYKQPDVISKRRTSTVSEEELKQEDVSKVALPRSQDLNNAFDDWFDNKNDEHPFFAFFWSIDPHMPYDPPEEFRSFTNSDYEGPADGERDCLTEIESEADLRQMRALYDGEIAYNDHSIGTLVNRLRAEDIYDDTLIIIIGDHGEAFREHGRLTHGHAPYDELIHVPFVIRLPSGEAVSNRIGSLCSLIDIYPTLLDYATDRAIPQKVQGTTLVDAIQNGSAEGHEYVFSKTSSYDMQNTFYGIRSDDWKYIEIETPDTGGRDLLKLVRYILQKGILTDIIRHPKYYFNRYRYSETEFLYELSTDPDETQNLIHEESAQAEELKRLLSDWHSSCVKLGENETTSESNTAIDEETQEQLRQLGYTD